MALLPLLLAATLAPADAAVATVDGYAIPAAELAARADAARRAGATPTPEALVEGLVDEALLAAEGRRRGLDRDPAVVAWLEDAKGRLAAARLERDVLASSRIDDATVRELFHAANDAFGVQQLAFASREEAAAAAARLQKGDVAGAAKGAIRADREPSTTTRMQLDPALADAVSAAAAGSVVGPVQLKVGWGVAKVTEKRIADEAGLAAQRDGLRAFADQQAAATVRQHLVSKLRAKANASVDERFIDSTAHRTDATPAELERPVGSATGVAVLYRDVLADVSQIAAGGGGAHASGPAVKKQVAWRLLDDRLLRAEALARGLGSDPAVQVRLEAYRTEVLAGATAAKVRAAASSTQADAAVRQLVKDLRARARIQVDSGAVKRAVRPS